MIFTHGFFSWEHFNQPMIYLQHMSEIYFISFYLLYIYYLLLLFLRLQKLKISSIIWEESFGLEKSSAGPLCVVVIDDNKSRRQENVLCTDTADVFAFSVRDPTHTSDF